MTTKDKVRSTEEALKLEPVAWINHNRNLLSWDKFFDDMEPLYTSPPNVPPARASKSRSDVKPWVGLTDEERNAIGRHHAYVDNIIRATEAKLKEKNDF